MLLELCVTELEDVASDIDAARNIPQPVVRESNHPYTDDTYLVVSTQIMVVWTPSFTFILMLTYILNL